jgi:hypothetical protein
MCLTSDLSLSLTNDQHLSRGRPRQDSKAMARAKAAACRGHPGPGRIDRILQMLHYGKPYPCPNLLDKQYLHSVTIRLVSGYRRCSMSLSEANVSKASSTFQEGKQVRLAEPQSSSRHTLRQYQSGPAEQSSGLILAWLPHEQIVDRLRATRWKGSRYSCTTHKEDLSLRGIPERLWP